MAHMYADGDPIRMIATPTQEGIVERCNPLGIYKGIAVLWSAGPLYSEGYMMAYFGANFDLLEPYTP